MCPDGVLVQQMLVTGEPVAQTDMHMWKDKQKQSQPHAREVFGDLRRFLLSCLQLVS